MTDEDIVAALAEALNETSYLGCEEFAPNDPDSGCPDCDDLVRAATGLLPAVRRVAEQWAAEERTHLTAAMADLLRLTYSVQLDSGTDAARAESERVADAFRARIADHCRERERRHRAAALTDHGKGQ